MDDGDPMQAHASRQAGIDALRKLRQLVDEELALTRKKAQWARRLGVLLALVAVAAVVWIVRRAPQ